MAPGTPDLPQFLGIRLPVTFDTCEVIEERWANWMRHDPVVAVETRRLKALYIDCGERDQFNLLYGARRLVRRLMSSASRTATRSSRITAAVSITGSTRACLCRAGAVRLMCMVLRKLAVPTNSCSSGTINRVAMTGGGEVPTRGSQTMAMIAMCNRNLDYDQAALDAAYDRPRRSPTAFCVTPRSPAARMSSPARIVASAVGSTPI
jgi:hypothetical protein